MAITLQEYKRLRSEGMKPGEIALQSKGSTGVKGFGVGIAKGALSTAFGAGRIGTKIGRALLPKFAEPKEPTIYERPKPEVLKPQTTAERLGFGTEQIAEFLIPSTKIAKLAKGTPLLGRAGIEAGTIGGTTAIQEGEIGDDAKTGAIIGAMFPVVGAGLKTFRPKGGVRKAIGEKIQQTVIRPNARDFRELKIKEGQDAGKKFIDIVNKYKLGGNLKETVLKSQNSINTRLNRLSELTKEGKGAVDVQDVLNNTLKGFKGKESKFRKFGTAQSMSKALKDLRNEVKLVVPDEKTPLNLVEATLMKRGAGTKSAWAFGQPDRDAKALDTVYTQFYLNLKRAIEKAAGKSGGEIKKLNKEISEIIPISNAALRRLPVEQRNNVISLSDSIGLFAAIFHPGALALIGANVLSKSGKFGNFLVKAAQQAKQKAITPPTTAIGERVFGGAKGLR